MGSNALLRDGAIAVSTGWDILSEYEAIFPGKIRSADQPAHMKAYPDELIEIEKAPLKVAQKPLSLVKNKTSKQKKDKKVIDNGEKPPYIDVEKKLPALTDEEQAIVDQLNQGDRLTDDVIDAVDLPAGKVLAVLTMLEVKGIIRRLPGNRIALKET
jgi:predicted Rossmann fold nucleotide-binding protein DprA/Smf involved in DNA uptake